MRRYWLSEYAVLSEPINQVPAITKRTPAAWTAADKGTTL